MSDRLKPWDVTRTASRRARRIERRNRFTALALVAALSGAATLATAPVARAWTTWPGCDDTAHGRLIDVQIQVGDRNVLLYPSPRWDGRRYFEAMKGREYAVTLRNTTNERIGVLVAVDGLNVISGTRSALTGGESMYVLDPHGSATIRGWRTSLNDIRRFLFVDEERSYATRTGQANGDLGWVRVLAFRENQPMVWHDQRCRIDERDIPEPQAAAPAAPEARGDGGASRANEAPRAARKDAEGPAGQAFGDKTEAESNPGTGWGRGSYDPVRKVEFVAQARPLDRIVLRYEYAGGLRALGIEPRREWDRTGQRDRGLLGFAQPPRW